MATALYLLGVSRHSTAKATYDVLGGNILRDNLGRIRAEVC